jgi:serine protease inhibitor
MVARGRPCNHAVARGMDRPFIFALQGLDAGAVLFLGRITRPEVRS